MPDTEILREILDAQLEMVCRFRSDGTILFVNYAYAASLGTTPEALAGCNLWYFVTGDDREHVEAMMRDLHRDRAEITIENRFETAQGPRWTVWRNHALEFDAAGHWTVAQSTGFDITERKLLEERMQLLIEELNHRVKNTLMVVQAMAFQSFRGTGMPAAPVEAFNQRLAAMAAAHTTLSRVNWGAAPLVALLQEGVAVCGDAERVHFSGPELTVSAAASVPLVMVLHELTTNALKYGALSVPEGAVTVTWSLDKDNRLAIEWTETGGPAVQPPVRTGFGSRMIRDAVAGQLGGVVAKDFAREGLHCRIVFPLADNDGVTA